MKTDIICLNCKHNTPFDGGCKAFPDGIPYEFSSGEKEHTEIVTGQVGDFVFEKDDESDDNEETEK